MLNIISQSPNSTRENELKSRFQSLSKQDAILLISDGLYWSHAHFGEAELYALEEHRLARGIPRDPNIKYINEHKFVQLTVDHEQIVSW